MHLTPDTSAPPLPALPVDDHQEALLAHSTALLLKRLTLFSIVFGILRSLGFIMNALANFRFYSQTFTVGRTVRGLYFLGLEGMFATCAIATLCGGILLASRRTSAALSFRIGGVAAIAYIVGNLYSAVEWAARVGREPVEYVTSDLTFYVAIHLVPLVLLALVLYRPTLRLFAGAARGAGIHSSALDEATQHSAMPLLHYSRALPEEDLHADLRARAFLLRLTAWAVIASGLPHVTYFVYSVLIQKHGVAWTRAERFDFSPFFLGMTFRDWASGVLVAGGTMLALRKKRAIRVCVIGIALSALSHLLLAFPLLWSLSHSLSTLIRVLQTWPYFLSLAFILTLLRLDLVRRELEICQPHLEGPTASP